MTNIISLPIIYYVKEFCYTTKLKPVVDNVVDLDKKSGDQLKLPL